MKITRIKFPFSFQHSTYWYFTPIYWARSSVRNPIYLSYIPKLALLNIAALYIYPRDFISFLRFCVYGGLWNQPNYFSSLGAKVSLKSSLGIILSVFVCPMQIIYWFHIIMLDTIIVLGVFKFKISRPLPMLQ